MKYFSIRFRIFCCMLFCLFLGFSASCQAKQNPLEAKLQAVLVIFEQKEIPLPNLTIENISAFLTELDEIVAADTDGLLILADKKHFLSADYEPLDLVTLVTTATYTVNKKGMQLRSSTEKALAQMGAAAKKDGITLLASSAYRSYKYQKTVYERNVTQMGKEAADRESAMPGASQHQLGTVIDFGSITDAFAETKAGKWLDKNANQYGFSLSFPDGYEKVTGYRWESWHYRYVGQKAALFQQKWFCDIQQYMLEFIHAWKNP